MSDQSGLISLTTSFAREVALDGISCAPVPSGFRVSSPIRRECVNGSWIEFAA